MQREIEHQLRMVGETWQTVTSSGKRVPQDATLACYTSESGMHYRSSLALQWAAALQQPAMNIASEMLKALPTMAGVGKMEAVQPGFMHFHVNADGHQIIVDRVLQQAADYGRHQPQSHRHAIVLSPIALEGRAQSIAVSRAVAIADTLQRLLEFHGVPTLCQETLATACVEGLACDVINLNTSSGESALNDMDEALVHLPESVLDLRVGDVRLQRDGRPLLDETEFQTSRGIDIYDEIGRDNLNYQYVRYPVAQTAVMDIDNATSCDVHNPAYHVQLAHARCCSAVRQADRQQCGFTSFTSFTSFTGDGVDSAPGRVLIGLLAAFPSVIERAASSCEPFRVTNYLRDLADGLHTYYDGRRKPVDDAATRLWLLRAVRQVLQNGLNLIDVAAPEVI